MSEIRAQIAQSLSNRWTLLAHLSFAQQYNGLSYISGDASLGAEFYLSSNVFLSAKVGYAVADYLHHENVDMVLSIEETLKWKHPFGLEYGIFFDQRRLIFNPLDYTFNASRSGTYWQFSKYLNDDIKLKIGTKVLLNIRSEWYSNDILQRIRLWTGVRKKMTPHLSLGLDYTCFLANKHQFYFSDRHNLHRLTFLIIPVFKKRN